MRKNLVVVRAGDRSLHPQWLDGLERNWDIAISYYGDNVHRYTGLYDYIHNFKGSKWEGISDFLIKFPNVDKYKYVWFPDDDIFTNGVNINRFFEICDLVGLTVAQPALTSYSYFSWPITRHDPGAIVRFTNFVEIMAPCFRTKELQLFSRFFGENTSGFGYEFLWWKLACEAGVANFGIVDETPVYHTRPVGSAGHGGSARRPSEEFDEIIEKFGLQKFQPQEMKRLIINA